LFLRLLIPVGTSLSCCRHVGKAAVAKQATVPLPSTFSVDLPISARRITLRERFLRWCKRNPLMAGMMALVAAVMLVEAVMAFRAERADRAVLAYRRLKDNDVDTMNDLLESCLKRLRHWGWY
jgi:hypothetical protein